MDLIELIELVTGERETIYQGLDGIKGKNWNDGINGSYEIDGANTTDGGIDTHGADISGVIDRTYANNRMGVFSLI